MKIFLFLCFIGLVPTAVSILQTVPHRYELNLSQVTWSVAQNYCIELYTDLAIILSPTDWVRLNKVGASKALTTSAWVGLYNDVNSWRWSLYDLPLKNVTYTYWESGQPDNYHGIESCGAVRDYGTWEDMDCTILQPFICYNDSFTDARKFIGISNIHMTWLGAREYCRKYHTDLASALNSTDTNYLWHLRDAQGNSWIGLYRDTWKWPNGMNASNLSWAPGKPDNSGGYANCASVKSGLFTDETCTNQHSFFCYTSSPMRSQIIRLQVKSDGSVLDSAVQSSVLAQIKQKLEENGMLENTTETWRVQPDGQIFYKNITKS